MSKIRIITDSSSDITKKRAEELGIRLIPISYTFDGEQYFRDGFDLSVEEFYEKLRSNSEIPKTTQVTPVEYEDCFREEFENGYDTLIVVTISSNGSGMYNNAVMTARDFSEETGCEVHVIDSKGFTCLTGAGVVHAAHMLKEGKSKEEILEFLNDVFDTMHSYFLVGELEHLKKGGRINTATLVLANMLDIKPVLTVAGGMVVQKDKIRGSKHIWKKLTEKATADGYDLSNSTVIIVNTAQQKKYEELKEELEKTFEGIKVKKCDIGAIVGCHGGPDLVGFVFSDKYDLGDYED